MALSNLTKVQTVGIGSNIEVVGVITTGQFKSGTSNLHSTGVELTNLNVSGIATIGGNLSIGGTLTYQDVTNIDSVGLITARSGINVSGGQLDVGSNIKLGNAGVITATTFKGNGDFVELDVDGHTNLDNVSIVGVTTFNGLSSNDVIRVRSADSNGNSVVNILSEGTTGNSRILFSDTAATSGDGWISYSHNDRALTFTTAGTSNERLRIRSDGKVLIGGSATTTSGLLNVKGNAVFDDGTNARITLQADGTSTNQILSTTTNFGSYTNMKYQAADHIFLYGGNELARIKADGNMLVGSHTAALSSYNSSQPRLSIYKSSGSGGYLELGGNLPHNGHSSGTIIFINNDNSEATSNNANGKILAMQRVENVTSDTNAGDDCGGDLVFMTKPEAGSLDERLRIKGDGSTFLQTSNVNINRGTAGAGYPLTVRGPADGDTIRIERANSYQWHIGQDSNSNLYYKANTTKEVVFPTSGGIAFNGDTAASNSLNDYEVGNWTSTVQWQNGNTTGSYNNTTAVAGTYVKVGNVVHVWITVYPNSYNSGSDCVILGITLPFNANSGGAVAFAPYSGQANYGGWLSVSTYPRTYAVIDSGNNRIQVLGTGNAQGAGFWGHKSGTVAANAQITATYYSA